MTDSNPQNPQAQAQAQAQNDPFASPDGPEGHSITDWTDLGREMWSYLTGRGAAVNYSFVDMTVEVPRDIGPDAPRATWKLNGTLRVTTSDDVSAGSDEFRKS
ncbi:hypothetical protein [Microbacterium aurantiacum]|uniref:hypothetical protein n=1 Tax=Microbacterium aurantiacum TaxID=162393 RepID=UPI003F495BCF